MLTPATFAATELNALRERHLYRTLRETERLDPPYVLRQGKRLISFASNDYFGLSVHPEVIAAAQEALARYGAGAGASRLVEGNHPYYAALEARLRAIKGTEAACVFGSGYLVALGVIPALAAKGDLILFDRLCHACMIDGVELSQAGWKRFRHNDMAHLQALLAEERNKYRRCLILTETVFGMDGDIAPLDEMIALAKRYDAMTLTDDAHGLGFVLPNSEITLQTGTLSKGVGGYGGYVCGSAELIDFLVNKARSLLFSTALPPAVAAGAARALELLQTDASLAAKPLEMADYFAKMMGWEAPQTPIIPLIVGEDEKAVALGQQLEEAGFFVPVIRPPTVPKGTARLRLSFAAFHSKEQVETLAFFLRKLL